MILLLLLPNSIDTHRILLRIILMFSILISIPIIIESKCKYKAIFNFGDSNSDTGGFWAAFPAQSGPSGMTFFHKPSGRASDGRLLIDFLAQGLGFPFLSPYLQSLGTDYRYGANFATLASTVLLPNTSLFVTGISPFSLAIQINQMKEFKARVFEFHHHKGINGSQRLPPPSIFRKSVFTFYIGQNDFTSNLAAIGIKGVKQYLPEVVSQIAGSIKELYELGGRTFLVQNLAPVGCYPAFLVELQPESSDIDEFGCMSSYNNAVIYYNKLLKESLTEIRETLPNAFVIFVDTHSVLLQLFHHPKLHGFEYGTKACCGYGGGAYNFDSRVFCGNRKIINGKNFIGKACHDPNKYVSWDGIHTTEAANKRLALGFLNGSLFDPPFPINRLCELNPIA